MPKIFLHGNPESAALWGPLLAVLEAEGVEDLQALSPPGFGSIRTSGFEATQVGYRDWLIQNLEALGGGVDLVGHDWGAGHLYGVLAERPDLIRSWAADCAGLIHRDYVWHPAAQIWQTPDLGEQSIVEMLGVSYEKRCATLMALGIPQAVAEPIARAQDEDMGRCILQLYRSASQPAMAELGRRLEAGPRRPGLVILATEDPYAGNRSINESVAEMLGAGTLVLEGLGHWWMFDRCEAIAKALVRHWSNA